MSSEKQVGVIAAISDNGVYGEGAELPWKLPKDLAHFKELTTDHTVVMGRGTWESLPSKFRPLPNRTNFIVTNTPGYSAKGTTIFASVEQAIAAATTEKVFCIGGIGIWYHALHVGLVDEIWITRVEGYYKIGPQTHLARDFLNPHEHWPDFYLKEQKKFGLEPVPFQIQHWVKAT
jgi:dihydrofolate reductase